MTEVGAVPTGLPAQPKGEKSSDTPTQLVGEESRSTLAEPRPSDGAPVPKKGTAPSSVTEMQNGDAGDGASVSSEKAALEIVRASAKIRIELPLKYERGAGSTETRSENGREAGITSASNGRDAGSATLVPNKEWKRLTDLLYSTQRTCARVMNVCTRELWRLDAEVLDANQGKLPKPWPMPKPGGLPTSTFLYQLSGRVAPELPGAMRSVLSKTCAERWAKTRFDALVRQNRSPAHYRDTIPIPLRAADTKIRRTGKDTFSITFILSSGKGQRITLPLRVKDKHQETICKRIIAGDWRMGDVALMRDRKNRWHVRIAYKRAVPATTDLRAAAINRGIKNFLVGVAEGTGDVIWQYPGSDIVAFLKQIQARRRDYQHDVIASGRTGHGRKRTLRPIERLQEKANNWRRTKCQTIARRFALWCVSRRVGIVYVEDFSGIRNSDLDEKNVKVWELVQEWPYYDLETRIISCLQEVGVIVVSVDSHYISQRCPSCGAVDPKHTDLKNWLLRCGACGRKEHLDVAAAKNVLARGREEAAKKNG